MVPMFDPQWSISQMVCTLGATVGLSGRAAGAQ
jgi:hypothetical protein